VKKKIPEIRYNSPKPITYYFCDLEGDKKAFDILKNVGKKVITEQEYVMIGFNHIVTNSKNNKFELTSLNKKSKSKNK